MITKEKLQKDFQIKRRNISGNEFIKFFIEPLEKGSNKLKSNLSENHDKYLLKIREGNM